MLVVVWSEMPSSLTMEWIFSCEIHLKPISTGVGTKMMIYFNTLQVYNWKKEKIEHKWRKIYWQKMQQKKISTNRNSKYKD